MVVLTLIYSEKWFQYEKVSFLGRNINIQDVKFAIMAKIAYIDKNPKHRKDLEEIIVNLINKINGRN